MFLLNCLLIFQLNCKFLLVVPVFNRDKLDSDKDVNIIRILNLTVIRMLI